MSTTLEIRVPDLGGATDVDVIEVHIKEGDLIKRDDPLITLEGDKATMEVPAVEEGVVKVVQVKVGDKVSQGSLIATLLLLTSTRPTLVSTPSSLEPDRAKPEPKKTYSPPSMQLKPSGVHAGPAVRRYGRILGVDLTKVKEGGPKGRILKEDLEAYVRNALAHKESPAYAPMPRAPQMPPVDFSKFGEIEKTPLSRIKKMTGANMQRNWQVIPHVTQFDEADITELEKFRKEHQKGAEGKGIKLTLLPFLVKAVVATLKIHPEFNASLDETGEYLILKKYFHIGIAVDTPEGLLVPVIRNVDRLGLFDCAEVLNRITQKARQHALTPGDFQGGCFTLSSLGALGGTAFTPIINAPDVAILGISRAMIKPVYLQNEFKPRLMLPLSLSYDHRVIDGVAAARFTTMLCQMLSDIRTLLL